MVHVWVQALAAIRAHHKAAAVKRAAGVYWRPFALIKGVHVELRRRQPRCPPHPRGSAAIRMIALLRRGISQLELIEIALFQYPLVVIAPATENLPREAREAATAFPRTSWPPAETQYRVDPGIESHPPVTFPE